MTNLLEYGEVILKLDAYLVFTFIILYICKKYLVRRIFQSRNSN